MWEHSFKNTCHEKEEEKNYIPSLLRYNRTDEFGLQDSFINDLEILLVSQYTSYLFRVANSWFSIFNRNTGTRKNPTTQRIPTIKLRSYLYKYSIEDYDVAKEYLERDTVLKN